MHDYLKPTYQKCKTNPSQEQTGTFLPKTRLSLNYESKKVKYHFRVENTEFRIPNYRYTGYRFFFPVNSSHCKTLYFLHTTKIKPVEVNVIFLYPLESIRKSQNFDVFREHKREY